MGWEQSSTKRGWHYNNATAQLEAFNNGNEIILYPYGTNYYVSKLGSDSNSGLSWAKSFLTIQAGLDACATAGSGAAARRGGINVYVAGGYYSEALTTPTNAQAPFGQLIAYSPSDISHGAVYVDSGATDAAWLTVLARGWRISGFEIQCPTAEAGVYLDHSTGNAAYTQIDGCHFTGGLYGINAAGAPNYITIRDNLFSLIQESGAIAVGASSGANCSLWVVENNMFQANINHIVFTSSSAPYSGLFRHNVFNDTWVISGQVTMDIDLTTQAGSNIITQNYLGGTYSIVGGYRGGPTDEWFGNYANVSGGVTQGDPG